MNFALIAAALFYPLIGGHWEKNAPLPANLLAPPESRIYLPGNVIRELQNYYLNQPSPEIRREILRDLHNSGNADTIPLLRQILIKEKNTNLQADIIRSIIFIAEQEKVSLPQEPSCQRMLDSDDISLRIAAAELLIRTNSNLNDVAAMLAKESTAQAALALSDVIRQHSARFTAVMWEKALASNVPEIRDLALRQTASLDPKAPALVKAYADGKASISTKLMLAEGLVSADPAVSEIALLRLLAKDPAASVRYAAATVPDTAKVLPKERIELLQSMLADSSSQVKARACQSLSIAPQTSDSRHPLLPLLHDPDPQVRISAGTTLGILSGDKVSKAVQEAISDPKSHYAVLLILKKVNNPKYADTALKILKETNEPRTIALAIEILGQLEYEDAIPEILKHLTDRDDQVKFAIAGAMQPFPENAEAANALKKLMFDSRDTVAVRAVDSIRSQNRKEYAPDLTRLAVGTSNVGAARVAAAHALSLMPDQITAGALNSCKTIVETACIKMPQAPPTYDTPYSRMACMMIVISSARSGNKKAEKQSIEMLEHIKHPTTQEEGEGFSDPALTEFARQAELILKGEMPSAMALPYSEPELAVTRINPDKE